MKFLIQKISQRAGGGEIVRRHEVEKTSLLIGRGSECDVVIPDLAVSLHHASLTEDSAGTLVISALSPVLLDINGEHLTTWRVETGVETVLLVGSYALTIKPSVESSEIFITSRKEHENPTGFFDRHSILFTGLFGLSARRISWISAIAIVGLCLALPIANFFYGNGDVLLRIHSDRQWSSGPLSPGHAFLEGNCKACHKIAFVPVRDDACTACHLSKNGNRSEVIAAAAMVRYEGSKAAPETIADHAPEDRLASADPANDRVSHRVAAFLWSAFRHPTSNCTSCHTEHMKLSDSNAETNPISVSRPDLLKPFDCSACHADMRRRLPDTTLKNVSGWSDHTDFEPLVFRRSGLSIRRERGILAPSLQDETGLKFSHRDHLIAFGPVAGMAMTIGDESGHHAQLTCVSCHHTDPTSGGFLPIEMNRDCSACHSLNFTIGDGVVRRLPHGNVGKLVTAIDQFTNRNAPVISGQMQRIRPGYQTVRTETQRDVALRVLHTVFSPKGVCLECHTVQWPQSSNSLAFKVMPVRLSGRFLPNGAFDHAILAHHETPDGVANCASCHAAASSTRSSDVLIPHIQSCARCHGAASAQTETAAPEQCAECHGYHQPGKSDLTEPTAINWTNKDPIGRRSSLIRN